MGLYSTVLYRYNSCLYIALQPICQLAKIVLRIFKFKMAPPSRHFHYYINLPIFLDKLGVDYLSFGSLSQSLSLLMDE